MTLHTLAHLSDLYSGQGPAPEAMARALCQAMIESAIDQVVVTRDLTHRGRDVEMASVLKVFAPLLRVPREIHLFTDTRRPLALYNAGCSTELGRARVFTHEAGRMRIAPRWLWADPGRAWGPRRVPVMLPAPLVPTERSVA